MKFSLGGIMSIIVGIIISIASYQEGKILFLFGSIPLIISGIIILFIDNLQESKDKKERKRLKELEANKKIKGGA